MEWLRENKLVGILAALGGVLLLMGGIWYSRSNDEVEVEIIENAKTEGGKVWVDVQGAVEAPGAYELDSQARVKDALAAAGGMSAKADRNWVARYVNMAQAIEDGFKIFIPIEGQVSAAALGETSSLTGESLVNINTASLKELDGLPGIGKTRAQTIIDGRPYGQVEELLSKKILPKNTFEEIKEKLSVF